MYVDQAFFPCARCPAETSALDAVPEAYHNPAAVWWGALCSFRGHPGPGGHRQTGRWSPRLTASATDHQLGRLRLGGLRPAFVQVINAGSCPLVTVVAGGSPLHRARNGHARGIGTQAAISRLGVASGVLLHICWDGGHGNGVGFRTRPGEGDSSDCELPPGSGVLVQLDHER